MIDSRNRTHERPFAPTWASPPGHTIEDLLDEQGWTQAELAKRLDFTRKHVNDLVKGRTPISPITAMRLESVFGAPANFWLNREAQYQETLERRRAFDRLESAADWLKEIPLADMGRLGWIERTRHKGEQVAICLQYFGVASVDAWRKQYEEAPVAFRSSPKFRKKFGSVAAWLRRAESEATRIHCVRFDKAGFKESLVEARRLTDQVDPGVFVPELVKLCAAHGVAVVFVPAPKGCPVSGAARWLSPDKALLVLSLRHKTNDHLWFTFFHEAAHLLLHSKKMQFVDMDDGVPDESEEQANSFAKNILIPPGHVSQLRLLASTRYVGKADVIQFAAQVGVAPGVVVGRMQKERWLPWSHLNGLKVSYTWQR